MLREGPGIDRILPLRKHQVSGCSFENVGNIRRRFRLAHMTGRPCRTQHTDLFPLCMTVRPTMNQAATHSTESGSAGVHFWILRSLFSGKGGPVSSIALEIRKKRASRQFAGSGATVVLVRRVKSACRTRMSRNASSVTILRQCPRSGTFTLLRKGPDRS